MFKRIFIPLAAAALLLFAIGCSAVPPLSDSFDEETVKQSAKDVISLINAQDGESLRNMSTTTLSDALTDEKLAEIYTAISENGAFTEFGEAAAFGSSDKSTGIEYAVVVQQAKYEAKALTYTISFDTDMKLAGIYYK
ncbi:MAG TPA: DUF3887 domain-containing protein [Clostridia bacterium]|nr:DUF3887 domain-containing protein [Clostridia bacterium]